MLSRRTKILIGLAAVVLISGLAVFFFLRHQVTKSFPVTAGSLILPGLHSRVTVSRDEYGVPVIEASDEHDLMMAAGFVHAQDRLWQMDMARRAVAGRLSEVFGAPTLAFDRMFRILGLARTGRAIEANLADASRNCLQWYADGVNALIAGQRGRYPAEFDMLGYVPEPWEPLHSVAVGQLMAWDLNLSWWTDLTLGAIAERVGLDHALDIFPTYPPDVDPIVPASVWRSYAGIGRGYLRTALAFREARGISGVMGGSNAWVVAPSRSASGKVILANDVHLQLHAPAMFYEMHLRAPGWDVGGMSIPGVPLIILGANTDIAWGLTNVMADDADFYIERLDSIDGTRYLYGKTWLPLSVREEEIGVKDDTAHTVRIRATHHGPVVSDIETPLKKTPHRIVASMRWTGLEPSDQSASFLAINRARTWEEFVAGVRLFPGPGQNFVYGDAAGNIGYWCGAKLPIRAKQNSTLPLPGWDPAVEWKGYVPFERLPHLFNPPAGFIATANNKIVDDSYPYHISDLWEPPSRIERLREVLGGQGVFTVEEFQRLQNDRMSSYARETLPHLLDAFADSALGMPEGELVFEYLRNWNLHFDADDIATSIYQQWYVLLLKNTYEDEMGEELFHDWQILVNVPIRVTARLLAEGSSPWFDDVRTDSAETRDDIIRKSLREAVTALRERLGPEMKTWRWGSLHTVTLMHPFGLVKPLDRIFNVGPFALGGGSTSLMSGEYSFNRPFDVTVAAAARQIMDFGTPGRVRRVLPGGQSGQVFHKHYDDQMHLWVNGGYRTALSMPPAGASGWERLVLEPQP